MLRTYALLHVSFQGINKFRYGTFVIMKTDADHPHLGPLSSIPLSITQRPGHILNSKHLFKVEHCISNCNLSLEFLILFPLLTSCNSSALCYTASTS